MRIVITNAKGGVGKTTTSIYFGTLLVHYGSVEVLDADPQGSATEWALRTEENGTPLSFEVVSVNNAQLLRAKLRTDFILIDTVPADAQGIDAALDAAQVAIIPTAPRGIDMSRVWATEAISSSAVETYVLLTQADPRTKAYKAALEVLETTGVGHFETATLGRVSIRQAFETLPGPDMGGHEKSVEDLLEATR